MKGPREKGQVNSDTKKIRTYVLPLSNTIRNKAGENYLVCHRQCNVRFMIPYTNSDTVVGFENEMVSAVAKWSSFEQA